jgi:hypothetical protein
MYNQAVSNVAQGFSPEDYAAQHDIVNDDTASFAGMMVKTPRGLNWF